MSPVHPQQLLGRLKVFSANGSTFADLTALAAALDTDTEASLAVAAHLKGSELLEKETKYDPIDLTSVVQLCGGKDGALAHLQKAQDASKKFGLLKDLIADIKEGAAAEGEAAS